MKLNNKRFKNIYKEIVNDSEVEIAEWDFIIRVNNEYVDDKNLLNELEQEFGANSVIAEDNSDDPLDYSLKAFSDLAFMPYVLAADKLDDVSGVIDSSGEFTQAFQRELSAYLKKRQGPAKMIHGKRLRKIVDPAVGACFVSNFNAKNK